MTRFAPGIMMGAFLIASTSVSDFMAAMKRMYVSEKIVIPLSVIFRFFPTIGEENAAITDAMRMRGIRFGGKHPGKMVEYRLIPLMISVVKIGDELSAAALARGLGAPVQRTDICKIGFHWQGHRDDPHLYRGLCPDVGKQVAGMIHMDHVTFTYQSDAAGGVRDIDLTIPEGQVAVLCGESGCGKTTVTRLINGLIPHYFEGKLSGSVHVGGKDVARQALWDTARQVGSVFQNPRSQFFNVDTTSEITFGCENLGMPREEILGRLAHTVSALKLEKLLDRSIFELSGGEKQKIACAGAFMMAPQVFVLDEVLISMAEEDETAVKDILARLDLTPYLERHPASLSGGQKQRLAIASAMAAERSVVFLDEPTSSLDYRHMLQTAQLLKELRQNGKTVYVITHDPELICQCCTDILHLEAGHIAACYPMDAAGVGRIRDFFRVDGVTT